MTQEPPPGPPQGWPGQPPPGPPPGQPPMGQPPMGPPPGQPPMGPPPGQPSYPLPGQEPRQGMSNAAKFWIGVPLSLPIAFVVFAATAAVSALFGALDPSTGGTLQGIATFLLNALFLGAWIWAVINPRTRFVALGVLAGTAIVGVLAAGACIVLIAAFISAY